MVWFQGSVAEAVNVCKQNAGVLGIFIRGESPQSVELDGMFAERDVAELVKKEPHLVLLRITYGSSDYHNLNSIYPVAFVPMIQFIDGTNGLLLFSVKPTNKEELQKGLQDGIDTWLHQRGAPAHQQATGHVGGNAEQHLVAHPVPVAIPELGPPTGSASSGNQDSSLDQDDLQTKVARAHEKAAAIRRRKEKEAEDLQREKERQRRTDGQLIAQAERERTVHQAEQVRLEIEKERLQEKEHLQKVRDQLRQDQEERAERHKSFRAPAAPIVPIAPKEIPSSTDYNRCRINFRYETAEGISTFIGDFSATDPLGDAFDLVRKQTSIRGEFTLLQMYPRRDFTKQDLKTTFRYLGLVPTGVLVVVPSGGIVRASSSPASPGLLQGLMAKIRYLLTLPLQGVNYVLGLLFPRQPIQGTDRDNSDNSGMTGSMTRNRDENIRRRPPSGRDEGTYNGNSTQQL